MKDTSLVAVNHRDKEKLHCFETKTQILNKSWLCHKMGIETKKSMYSQKNNSCPQIFSLVYLYSPSNQKYQLTIFVTFKSSNCKRGRTKRTPTYAEETHYSSGPTQHILKSWGAISQWWCCTKTDRIQVTTHNSLFSPLSQQSAVWRSSVKQSRQ